MKKTLAIGALIAVFGLGASNSAQAGNTFSFGISFGEPCRPAYVVPAPLPCVFAPRYVWRETYQRVAELEHKENRRVAERDRKEIARERELQHKHPHRY